MPIPECQLCKDDLRTATFSGRPTLVGKYHELGAQGQVLCTNRAEIGDDLAAVLGITHYDPPTADELEGRRSHAGADVALPPMIYAPEYDVESVYKYADCFEPGEPVYVTEKIHGASARFVTVENVLHCGSRKEWKKQEGRSIWWQVVEQNPWIDKWCKNNQYKVLYGEIFGAVQNLKYGAKPGQLWFRAFDIMDGTEYFSAQAFIDALPHEYRVPQLLSNPTVECSRSGLFMSFDFEKLQHLSDGPSLVPGANHIREGIVIKPLVERRHWKLGRVMVKMVGLNYLERDNK